MKNTQVVDSLDNDSFKTQTFPTGRPLRLAIVGAGSLGLYYGIKFAEAGWDVHFLMRSGFEEAKSAGIRLLSQFGDRHLKNPKVYQKTEDMGWMDCVFISLKATANSILKTVIPPLVSAETAVITIENGLGSEEVLAQFLPAHQILGALSFSSLTRSSPIVVHEGGSGSASIGEYSQKIISPRVKTLVANLQSVGHQAKAVTDLMEERWRKLVWNIPFNGLAVTERKVTVDRILSTPSLLAKCKGLMQEVITAANALGFPIEADYQNFQLERSAHMGAYRPSTLIDFEAGRELEVEAIWGTPLRRAQAAGLEMPYLTQLYRRLCELNPGSVNQESK